MQKIEGLDISEVGFRALIAEYLSQHPCQHPSMLTRQATRALGLGFITCVVFPNDFVPVRHPSSLISHAGVRWSV
jgi:hypothetical protein